MVHVIAWPPLGLHGYENTIDAPISLSRSVLTGRRYASAAQTARRVATAITSGIGPDGGGAGYIEMLKRQLGGGINLVRLALCSPNYRGDVRGLGLLRGERPMDWTYGGSSLNWTNGGSGMDWVVGAPVSGTAGILEGMPVLYCTGLPKNRRIAWPSEVVRVVDEAEAAHTARVMRVATSDATGMAVLYLDAALPDGAVLIGFRESVVYEVENANALRAVQQMRGDWTYTFQLREVFEDETDGFVEVDPWH
jgi:hypothetical protein